MPEKKKVEEKPKVIKSKSVKEKLTDEKKVEEKKSVKESEVKKVSIKVLKEANEEALKAEKKLDDVEEKFAKLLAEPEKLDDDDLRDIIRNSKKYFSLAHYLLEERKKAKLLAKVQKGA